MLTRESDESLLSVRRVSKVNLVLFCGSGSLSTVSLEKVRCRFSMAARRSSTDVRLSMSRRIAMGSFSPLDDLKDPIGNISEERVLDACDLLLRWVDLSGESSFLRLACLTGLVCSFTSLLGFSSLPSAGLFSLFSPDETLSGDSLAPLGDA